MISKAMRERLRANRLGQLHRQQWLDLVFQPVVVTLLLFVPVALVLGARATVLVVSRTWGLAMIALVIFMVLRVGLRAWRVLRTPIQHAILRGSPVVTAPWQPQQLETEAGDVMRFRYRLMPPLRFRVESRYLVYYLRDGDSHVLLSAIPLDHPDAGRYLPPETPPHTQG